MRGRAASPLPSVEELRAKAMAAELAGLREAHRGLLTDHRAMQAAFLDLLARMQRLEAAEERRAFAGAVRDLRGGDVVHLREVR